jgi:hypothetical protein
MSLADVTYRTVVLDLSPPSSDPAGQVESNSRTTVERPNSRAPTHTHPPTGQHTILYGPATSLEVSPCRALSLENTWHRTSHRPATTRSTTNAQLLYFHSVCTPPAATQAHVHPAAAEGHRYTPVLCSSSTPKQSHCMVTQESRWSTATTAGR